MVLSFRSASVSAAGIAHKWGFAALRTHQALILWPINPVDRHAGRWQSGRRHRHCESHLRSTLTPDPLEIGGTATLPGLSAEGGVSLSDPPITLSDFVVPTGRLLANSALITAGRNSQNFLLRTDTNTLGTLEDGDFPANITRIRDRGPNDFQLNDNPNIADIEAFFATGGDGADYWIHIQDAAGVASIEASTLDTGASNANNARFDSTQRIRYHRLSHCRRRPLHYRVH